MKDKYPFLLVQEINYLIFDRFDEVISYLISLACVSSETHNLQVVFTGI